MSNSHNFTERVRTVLSLARDEAHRLEHDYVGTEHMLLGLIREGAGVATTAMEGLGIDPEKVRQDVINAVKHGEHDESRGPDLPYTSRAKKVLEFSMHEALNLKHTYVGTEHVLLGLLVEGKGIAAQVLRQNDADTDQVRAEVLRLLGVRDQPKRTLSGTDIESVTITVRFTDGSFQQDVFRDVASAAQHLAQ
ncbi:MAG: Clp protease N-terminal domain-containing protein [Gemmatimonadaceae bacterium]